MHLQLLGFLWDTLYVVVPHLNIYSRFGAKPDIPLPSTYLVYNKYDNYQCYVVWKIIELHLLLLNLDTVVKRNVWEMSVNQQQQQTNNGDFYQVKTVICR